MKTTIALSTAALLALSAPAFAGAHNQGANASDNAERSQAAADNLGKVPPGLLNENAGKGLSAATTKGGNGK